jgi:hypothetical protein
MRPYSVAPVDLVTLRDGVEQACAIATRDAAQSDQSRGRRVNKAGRG